MAEFNRRKFLKAVCAGTCGSLIHHALTPRSSYMAFAAPPIIGALAANPILLVINLAGGPSQNMLPTFSDFYLDANPNIGYAAPGNTSGNQGTALTLNGIATQGLHPSFLNLQGLFNQNAVAICNLVGGPNALRAHDLSTIQKLTGITADQSSEFGGWPCRLTQQISSIFGGVSVQNGESLVTEGTGANPVQSIGSLGNTEANYLGAYWQAVRDQLISGEPSATTANAALAKVQLSMTQVQSMAQTFVTLSKTKLPFGGFTNQNTFPAKGFPNSSFGQAMQNAAQIASANVGTQFIFVERGGNDTHSVETQSMPALLTDVDQAIGALAANAISQGWWSRLIIVTLGEFCRTAFENENQGTDHGNAGPVFVIGGGVKGGIYAPAPTLADTMGTTYYANYHIDFRSIFQEAIQAMGYNAGLVFPEAFSYSPLGLFS